MNLERNSHHLGQLAYGLRGLVFGAFVFVASGLKAGTPQEISFPEITDHLTTDAPFTLQAVASSALPVAYTMVSPAGVATVTNDIASLTGVAGAVTVKASQAGDATYDPAPAVYRTFTVADAALRFVKIAVGPVAYHSLGIRADGSLWAWGRNDSGQLGDGSNLDRYTYVQVGSDTNWVSVARGSAHSLGVRNDGTLWAWGSNSYGQLGDGTTTGRLTPVQVGSDTNWSAVSCGYYHTLAVRDDGTLWAWGSNTYAQLGDGTAIQRLSPVQVGSAMNWASVSCGELYTVALRDDGTVWAWGDNVSGQLGNGSTIDQSSPVQIGSSTDWKMVACGGSHTSGVRDDGTLWAWGANHYGQVGNGEVDNFGERSPVQVGTATNWLTVQCGHAHTLAVRDDGTLWTWGVNTVGQLGDGSFVTRLSPVQVGTATNWGEVTGGVSGGYGLRTNGTLWAWGDAYHGQLAHGVGGTQQSSPQRVGRSQGWGQAASGTSHSLGVREDGTLWAWGESTLGRLGVGPGSAFHALTPIQVGSASNWILAACRSVHSAGLRSDGTLWVWGSNASGQLGLGTSNATHYSPQQVGTSTLWESVSFGLSHTAAVRSDGTLWTWGNNSSGQLGDGSTSGQLSPVQVGSETHWVDVICGDNHTAGLRSDGTLWAWGQNIYRQLGDGTTTQRTSPVQVGTATNWVDVACGATHTIAVRGDGTLWTWGRNNNGQLGRGDTLTPVAPAQVGSATNWIAVACGSSHSVALRSDGTLWSWGSNAYGQLGDGSAAPIRTSPTPIGTGMSWASVTCGSGHTMAVRADGALWTWGLDDQGQLGLRVQASPERVWPERASQTVTFSALPSVLVAGQSVGLNASASSGLPTGYAVAGNAFLQSEQLITTVRGMARATASQNGDDAWASAEPSLQTLSVINQTDIAIQGNGTEIASGDNTPSALDHTDFGNATLVNEQVQRTFLVANQGASVLLLNSTPRVIISGQHPQDFKVTSLPASPVASGASTFFTITFDPTLPGARSAMVMVESDDLEKTPYTFAIGGFCTTSAPLKQTITFNAPGTVYVGESPLTLTAYSDSGLPVSLSIITGHATLTGNLLSAGSARSVTVQATQPGAGNYGAATPVVRTINFIDNPGALTLIKLNQIYDGTPKPIGSLGTSLAATITYRVGSAYVPNAPTNAGSYAVKAVAGVSTKTGTLVITKPPLVITPDDKRKFTGRTNPPLTALISGFKGTDTAAVLTKAPVLSTTATMTSPGGLYPIKSSGGIAANYTFIHRQGTLVIESFTGSYEALLTDGTSLPVGKISLTVAAVGSSFTGKLHTAEETSPIPLSGLLATDTVNGLASGQVTMLKNGIPYVTGFTLPMYGDVLADVTRDSLPLGTSSNGRKLSTRTVTHHGAYTAVLESATPTNASVPVGSGWAVATIGTNGVMTLAGKLADGAGFTTTLTPDVEADPGYRLFVQPYLKVRTGAYLVGMFRLRPHPSFSQLRYTDAAAMTWVKAGLQTDDSYRAGFGPVNAVLTLDPWLKPSSSQTLATRLGLTSGAFNFMHSATASASDSNLPTQLLLGNTHVVTVLNQITSPANPTKWKVSLVPTTGMFSGSFELVDGLQRRLVPFSGVLRQPSTALDPLIGDGHFLIPPLTGALSNEKLSGEVQFVRP